MSETELKLELDPDAADALISLEPFAGNAEPKERRDIYFDTPDHELRQAGLSLRIRESGGTFLQTVKATPSGSSDIYSRGEWEMPVEDRKPVIDQSTPVHEHLAGQGTKLAALFEIRAERRTWLLKQGNAEIEAALDRGMVAAGDRQAPVCELELELKQGDADALFDLARRICESTPCRIGVVSKSERAYQLMEALKTVYKAEPLRLDRSMTAAASFQAIASACFRHYRLNETILLKQRQPEALHRARVAIRRLRSAFVIYKPILGEGETTRLKDELRWLASVLGNARDIDVLLSKARGEELGTRLGTARERAYDEVAEVLRSRRVTSLFLDFNHWLRCGDYLRPDQSVGQLLVADFASRALDRMLKKLRIHGHALAELDDEHRHEARKDAKKFRYAAEFFASLYDDRNGTRRYKRFIGAMEELQDHLGALNDLATGPSVLAKLGLEGHPGARRLNPSGSKPALIEQAQAALDQVADLKRFWK